MLAMPEEVVLGFDFGMRNIGVALGHAMLQSARPLTTLIALDGEPEWDKIAKLIKEWRVNALIVGIPVNIDGTEQEITLAAKNFAAILQQKFKLPLYCVDERLSTKAARQQLFDEGGYRKLQQAQVDSYAAKVIVEQWLFEHKMEQKS